MTDASSSSWWQPQLRPDLEQGDLINCDLQFQLLLPVTYISKGQTGKGQKKIWEESASAPTLTENETTKVIATVHSGFALVLTYGCEMENINANTPILLAPVHEIAKLPETMREQVLAQKALRYIPVVDIPNIGVGYANLARTFSIPYRLVKSDSRIKSMTDDGIFRVQQQIVAYYTRLLLPPKQ